MAGARRDCERIESPGVSSTQAPSPVPPQRASRGRRIAARVLVVVGVVLAVVSIAANFVERTALDSDQWEETTAKLLADEDIQQATATYLVDQLYENVEVADELEAQLPEDFKGLSPIIAGAAREIAQRAAVELLKQPRVQDVFVAASSLTQKQVVALLDGGSGALTATDGAVVLDLRPIVLDLSDRVGVGGLAEKLPDDVGRITVVPSDELATAQDATKALRFVADWLWVLFIGAWALAIWLHRGGRRIEVRAIAWGLVIVGIALLALRAVAGSSIVDALATTESVRPAVEAAWAIGTDALKDAAYTVLVIGLVGLLGVWLSSPRTRAVGMRRWLAPHLQRPEVAYGSLLVLVLLVVLWGPTVQSRELLTVVILAAIAAIGVEALRRQTAREFPHAEGQDLGAGIASLAARARGQAAEWQEARSSGEAEASSHVADLERLAALHAAGSISDDEYAAAKARVLEG
jgi:hypothetical protein